MNGRMDHQGCRLMTHHPLLITRHYLLTVFITGEYQEYYQQIYGSEG